MAAGRGRANCSTGAGAQEAAADRALGGVIGVGAARDAEDQRQPYRAAGKRSFGHAWYALHRVDVSGDTHAADVTSPPSAADQPRASAGCFQPIHSQTAPPMTRSRSLPASHGSSSVNIVTHCR